MQKSVEFTGKTEELAISAALAQLGLAREEVSVEVLQLARSGFLGIGGTPAKIKVTYEAPDEPAPPPPPPPEPVQELPEPPEPPKRPEKIVYEAPNPERSEQKKPPKPPKPSKEKEPKRAHEAAPRKPDHAEKAPAVTPDREDDRTEKIRVFLTGLLERMKIQAKPEISIDDEGNYQVNLVGKNLGQAIGRRGETLDAIQQLTGYVINRGQSHRVRVRVDAENYRSKREDTLIRMARRTAEKAVRSHRNFTLEPMNAYERHVIHTALQDWPDVTTYSVGVEPGRRTVVAYSPGEHKS